MIAKIQRDVAAVLDDPAFKERYIDAAGYTVVASTPEVFAEFIRNDLRYKKTLIEAAGIEPEWLYRTWSVAFQMRVGRRSP